MTTGELLQSRGWKPRPQENGKHPLWSNDDYLEPLQLRHAIEIVYSEISDELAEKHQSQGEQRVS